MPTDYRGDGVKVKIGAARDKDNASELHSRRAWLAKRLGQASCVGKRMNPTQPLAGRNAYVFAMISLGTATVASPVQPTKSGELQLPGAAASGA